MPKQHPLTDDMMYDINSKKPEWSCPFDEEDMRAAYDKGSANMLETVIEWLYDYESLDLFPPALDFIVEQLEKAIRPEQ